MFMPWWWRVGNSCPWANPFFYAPKFCFRANLQIVLSPEFQGHMTHVFLRNEDLHPPSLICVHYHCNSQIQWRAWDPKKLVRIPQVLDGAEENANKHAWSVASILCTLCFTRFFHGHFSGRDFCSRAWRCCNIRTRDQPSCSGQVGCSVWPDLLHKPKAMNSLTLQRIPEKNDSNRTCFSRMHTQTHTPPT
jgi:hypothetical protein